MKKEYHYRDHISPNWFQRARTQSLTSIAYRERL